MRQETRRKRPKMMPKQILHIIAAIAGKISLQNGPDKKMRKNPGHGSHYGGNDSQFLPMTRPRGEDYHSHRHLVETGG